MKVIARPIQSGKTTELIKQSSEENWSIVCRNMERCKQTLRMAKQLGYSIPHPITIRELLDPRNANRRDVLVDDIDACMDILLPGRTRITAATISTGHPECAEESPGLRALFISGDPL
jgi:hypothetical protein